MITLMKMSGGVMHRQSMRCRQKMNVITTSQLENLVLYVTCSCTVCMYTLLAACKYCGIYVHTYSLCVRTVAMRMYVTVCAYLFV